MIQGGLMSRFIALFLTFTFVLQTAAFAVNPEEVAANSVQGQMAIKNELRKVSSRYEKLSDVKKLKFLNRQEKRLARSLRKIDNMSDKKFERLLNRLDRAEYDKELEELSSEEQLVFASAETQNIDQAEVDKAIRQIKRKPLLNKIESALETVKQEKLNIAGKITKTDDSKEASRSIASNTCEKLSFAFLIAGAAAFVLGMVLTIITGGIGLLVMGLTGVAMGTIGLMSCEQSYDDYWY